MKRSAIWVSFPFVLLVAWIAFIWWGYGILKARPVKQRCPSASEKTSLPHASALRTMPRNWLIDDADLKWANTGDHPNLKGRYVACELNEGDFVIEQDTRYAPLIGAVKGKIPYMLPLESPAGINAGVRVAIFPETGRPLVNDARILFIICSDHCSAAIEVTTAESDVLGQQESEKITIVPRE
jgi:hypothetical protein